MRHRVSLAALASLICLISAALPVQAQEREEARLLTASQVLNDSMSSPDQALPERLLERAYGIAVVPDVTKVAFFLGGRRGNGVLVARDASGRFSDPVFVNLTGGSFGFQWGVQSTDVILVFTTRRSIDRISSGKLTLGADASVAAGPVGRQASAATDPTLSAEVYSYSRSRGLFAGVALDGSALTIDDRANSRFYDKGTVNIQDVLNGALHTNDSSAHRFRDTVARSTGATSAPPPVAAPQAPVSAPPPPAGAQTFPLADPKPGQEPTSN